MGQPPFIVVEYCRACKSPLPDYRIQKQLDLHRRKFNNYFCVNCLRYGKANDVKCIECEKSIGEDRAKFYCSDCRNTRKNMTDIYRQVTYTYGS